MHCKYSHFSYLRALCFFVGMMLTSYATATLPPAINSEEDLPVLMVNIQDHAVASTTASVPAFTPYHGAIERSPYLGWLILICAWLLPAGMLVVRLPPCLNFANAGGTMNYLLRLWQHTK
ncbi:hypothetical protein ACO0LG_15805 [Undibacterium sp. Ji42W]|uniref:hypothetical protein n=1 Tax=Undibacterium sp. Ji42W TaxID=3413039 RepID=UPI003BEF9214